MKPPRPLQPFRQVKEDGHGAKPRTGIAARRVLVAEQHRRDPVRRPPGGGHNRSEQRHHRCAHRGGQMRRPGVAHDHHGGAIEDGGQRAQVGAAAEVDAAAAGHLGGEVPLAGRAGDQHAIPGGGQCSHRACAVLHGPFPGWN